MANITQLKHLEHIEDEMLNHGVDGCTASVSAMKEMLKARVVAKRSVHSVINEKKFLSQLYHPFLVNMNYAFDDRENLYLVIDLMTGGDLRYHLAKHKRFSEK